MKMPSRKDGGWGGEKYPNRANSTCKMAEIKGRVLHMQPPETRPGRPNSGAVWRVAVLRLDPAQLCKHMSRI